VHRRSKGDERHIRSELARLGHLEDFAAGGVGDLFAEKAVPVIDPASGGSALA